MTKRPLPPDRKDECLKLKAIYNAKKRDLELTQEKLADLMRMNQSSVSHYLNGINPLNTAVAAEFARILEVPVSEFSPRLAMDIERLSSAQNAWHTASEIGRALEKRALDTPPIEQYVLIPQYNANERFVPGVNDEHVGLTEGLVFRRGWLRRMEVQLAGLFIIFADHDDMAPHISSGDVVLFDASQCKPEDKQIYLIQRADGAISLKRMIRQMSGSWVIRSDNPDKNLYQDEVVSEAVMAGLPILGKVIWRGGSTR
jgi:phage repressor protein C with HTH and peptisase S24 domain